MVQKDNVPKSIIVIIKISMLSNVNTKIYFNSYITIKLSIILLLAIKYFHSLSFLEKKKNEN